MDVTLIYKWAYDPDDILVYEDGSTKCRRGKYVASDDEAEAIVHARALAGATGGTLTAVTIGNGDVSWALARGAARAVSAEGLTSGSDDAQAAAALAAVVRAAGATDVVVMGDARDRSGVAPLVAAGLGIPFVGGVQDFVADAGVQGSLLVHRATDEGVETLRCMPPVLLSVAATDSEANVPSMKQMLAAKKLPVEKADADVVGEGERPRAVVTGAHLPHTRNARMFEGEPDQAAADLFAALRADGVL